MICLLLMDFVVKFHTRLQFVNEIVLNLDSMALSLILQDMNSNYFLHYLMQRLVQNIIVII